LAAKSVWRTVCPEGWKLAPVHLGAAAAALGLEIVAWRPAESRLNGALIRGAHAIFINASLAPARARFTAAHEFGHYVLGHRGDHYCYDGLRTAEEREASRFAAAFLMPTAVVKALWLKLGGLSPTAKVATVAERLAVSRQALGYRLEALGLTVRPSFSARY